jgi:hypothetical protein
MIDISRLKDYGCKPAQLPPKPGDNDWDKRIAVFKICSSPVLMHKATGNIIAGPFIFNITLRGCIRILESNGWIVEPFI